MAVYTQTMLLVSLTIAAIYVKINLNDVVIFTDAAAPSLTICCSMLRIMRFYLSRHRLKKLTDFVGNQTNEIKAEDEQKF